MEHEWSAYRDRQWQDKFLSSLNDLAKVLERLACALEHDEQEHSVSRLLPPEPNLLRRRQD